MPARDTCSQCATPLPANAPQGLCPRCLLGVALGALPFASDPLSSTPPPKREKSKAQAPVGDYELLEEVARGGMGIVFRARQISLNRIVAVKALLFGEFASDEFVARFRAEAQAAAGLQHPNIVAIHDVWQHGGQHFFSMEFVEGETLAHLLKDGPLAVKRAARYAEIIARAVHFAHERGIVHRDLKPANVLIDSANQPRITDFGLAKRLTADGASPSCNIVGSPHYMSPEQSGQRCLQIGPGSDTYSIGAMLYHMLTGRPPVVGETIEEVLAQTLTAEPVSPRLLNQSVSRDLETICLKCLQKDPRRRYASALELADDLDRFLHNLPIHARPINRAERTIRWCRRNPAPTVILILLATVAAASAWASFHFKHLNREVKIGQYVSDMNVAMRHLGDGDVGHAVTLLKAHVPSPNAPDIRGFEWRHMWWLCRGNFEEWLPTHPQVVGKIHFSSDAKNVLTYTWDSTVRIWDPVARRGILTLTNVSAIGGFTADETAIVVNRSNGAVQIIDAKTGATNRTIPGVGQLVAYSRQTEIVAARDQNDRLIVRRLQDSQPILIISNAPPAKLHYSWNSPVTISADGSKLAVIFPYSNPLLPAREIRLWNLKTGVELDPLPENRELRCLIFSPDASKLLTGDGQGMVRVWDLSTGERNDIAAHTTNAVPVLSIAFSPDGKTFATGSSDSKSIRLWDAIMLAPKENEFRGQAGDVWSLAFAPDGKRLASGTRDGLIRIWHVDRAKPTPALARLHADKYANIVFSSDSRFLAGGCEDNTVKIWSVTTLEVVAIIPRASYVVAFSIDNQRLLVASKDNRPFWWDIEKRTSEKLPSYRGDLSEVVSVAISPNRRFAALGMADGQIRMVNMETGLPVGAPFQRHAGPVYSLAFSPDGEKLASGGADMNVMVWDIKTGASLGACEEHKAAVFGVAISPDGQTLASGCGAETIKLWDVNNVAKRAWASASLHRSAIRALSFTPDNRTLASGSEDRTVKLWNVAASSKAKSAVEVASFTFLESLRAVQFSPDGNALAAVTDKGALRIFRAYSLQESDRQIAELR